MVFGNKNKSSSLHKGKNSTSQSSWPKGNIWTLKILTKNKFKNSAFLKTSIKILKLFKSQFADFTIDSEINWKCFRYLRKRKLE